MYIKTAKNGGFSGELISENDFEAILATFCCYDYMVPTLLRKFRRCCRSKRLSQMPLACYSLLNSQNIPISNSEKRLVTNTSDVAQKVAVVAQKKEQ